MNGLLIHSPWLMTVANVFASANAPLYAVGGAVRNRVMGLPASDMDLSGPAHPDQVLSFCKDTPVRAVARAAHFGTVELHVSDAQGRHMAEYTTFRVDSYRTGHQPVAVRFADTLEEDALRRDFSVNALYCPMNASMDSAPEVIDPTGGLSHLKQKILHTVTQDPDHVLQDDGLRILRAARFQAELDLRPTEVLLHSARKYVGLLGDIALERVRDELTRLLLSDMKYPTLQRNEYPVPAGLNTLRTVGAWPAVFGALPPEDGAIAATAYYQPVPGISAVAGKMALLFPSAHPSLLSERMCRLRFATREANEAAAALQATQLLASDTFTRMSVVRLGFPALEHALSAFDAWREAGLPCQAAWTRTRELHSEIMRRQIPYRLADLAVHGDDLLPLCQELQLSGRFIGMALDALWQSTVEARIPNEREALMAEAKRLLSSKGNS